MAWPHQGRKAPIWVEHFDIDVEATVLQAVIVVDRKAQEVVALYTLADLDDQVSVVEEESGYLEGTVRLACYLRDHRQLYSWQTCKHLSSYHNLVGFQIR